ncbi:hypothetical protein FA95DRAFT_655645 [Auriscalpium vulgare]|uniref:Uncharacterized protein n=1 Tax=Auriscalpium vulgare TaxID=40419 RepID=A0ACB8RCG6_9AGAM|nr:hypothetical protein FA95DRAFT_655645 [Auriscalpium vulgare]
MEGLQSATELRRRLPECTQSLRTVGARRGRRGSVRSRERGSMFYRRRQTRSSVSQGRGARGAGVGAPSRAAARHIGAAERCARGPLVQGTGEVGCMTGLIRKNMSCFIVPRLLHRWPAPVFLPHGQSMTTADSTGAPTTVRSSTLGKLLSSGRAYVCISSSGAEITTPQLCSRLLWYRWRAMSCHGSRQPMGMSNLCRLHCITMTSRPESAEILNLLDVGG